MYIPAGKWREHEIHRSSSRTTITVTEAAKANYKGSAAVVINNVNKKSVAATKFNEDIKVWDEDANAGYKLGQTKNTVDVTNNSTTYQQLVLS